MDPDKVPTLVNVTLKRCLTFRIEDYIRDVNDYLWQVVVDSISLTFASVHQENE